MAEEPQKPAEKVAAAVAVPEPEKETHSDKPIAEAEKEPHPEKPVAEPEPEKEAGDGDGDGDGAGAGEKKAEEEAEAGKTTQITQSVSFKEETNVVADLPEVQKKALDELKHLIQDALNKRQLYAPPPPKEEEKKEEEVVATEEEEKKKKKEQERKQGEVAATTEKEDEEAVVAEEEENSKKEEEGEKTEEPKIEEISEAAEEASKEKEAEVVEETTVEVEVVAAPEVVEKAEAAATAVEEEGSKTVEAIKETEVAAVAIEEAPPSTEAEAEAKVKVVVEEETDLPPEEVEIWGIPLLADERSDVILLKFLRARDFKVKDAFTMLKNTVRWRKEFGIEALAEEELGSEWDKVVFSHGYDKEGHPVCYNVFGEFEKKELYQKTFWDEEKRHKFIRWRIQFLEKSVRRLDFSPSPGAISTVVQVNDLRNSPGLSKRELRQATNQALQLLQDNYPEFVAKQVFINVPWWYLAFSRMISAFLTQRTKSKFVFAGPSKSAETLFKYIAPEQVPVQYGGLSRDGEGEQEFSTADPVAEVTIKPATKHTVEFPFSEKGHLVWEVRVVGWDVSYGAEFVPSAEDGYTVIVQKSRKIGAADETVISNSFKIGEPGKVVLTIHNQTSKKKKLLYRSNTKLISD